MVFSYSSNKFIFISWLKFILHFPIFSQKIHQASKTFYFLIGTRIGQASDCFVYWKDPMTNDTWGLNFTSPIDAKQFRECCVSINTNYINQ